MSEDTCLCPYKDYSSLLGGKLTVFTFYNYEIVLAKLSRVILRLFQLILLFMRLILLFVSFEEILGMRVLILLFMLVVRSECACKCWSVMGMCEGC
jgi:hypothetical protein